MFLQKVVLQETTDTENLYPDSVLEKCKPNSHIRNSTEEKVGAGENVEEVEP